VSGTGCPAGYSPPEVFFDDLADTWVIDVDLLGCHYGTPQLAFAYDVPVGRLYPRAYEVRIQDAIRHSGIRQRGFGAPITPPPSPFDVDQLTVHRHAQLVIEPLGPLTDEAPARVAISGLASSDCFQLEGPEAVDDAFELIFVDNCPILPPGGPNVFREERELGTLTPGTYEVRVFDHTGFDPGTPSPLARSAVTVHDASACVPSADTLCLANRRFAVTATWEDYQGTTGFGRAVFLPGRDSSGLFWFFGPRNVELSIKVLEGCGINGHWWVYLSSGSDVAYRVVVRDTVTGEEWTHENPLGVAPPLARDIQAFSCGS
jgi:hypothetical protein